MVQPTTPILLSLLLCLFIALVCLFRGGTLDKKNCNDCLKLQVPELSVNTSTIYFLETGDRTELGDMELCAIEAAAQTMPNRTVLVLLRSGMVSPKTASLSTMLENIEFRRLDLGQLFNEDSLLLPWFQSGAWQWSRHQMSHLSEAGRLALLYRFGGSYLDLDLVTLQPFENVPAAYIPLARFTDGRDFTQNAALLNWPPKHPYMAAALKLFRSTYNENSYVVNGPFLMQRTLRSLGWCTVRPGQCEKVYLGDSRTSHGLDWWDSRKAFTSKWPRWTEDKLRELNQSSVVGVHLWGKHTRHLVLREQSLMGMFSVEKCPIAAERMIKP